MHKHDLTVVRVNEVKLYVFCVRARLTRLFLSHPAGPREYNDVIQEERWMRSDSIWDRRSAEVQAHKVIIVGIFKVQLTKDWSNSVAIIIWPHYVIWVWLLYSVHYNQDNVGLELLSHFENNTFLKCQLIKPTRPLILPFRWLPPQLYCENQDIISPHAGACSWNSLNQHFYWHQRCLY